MPPEDVRRSGRIPKEIAIILLGSDAEGRGFSEDTKTLVLSRHGATILSRRKLVPEQQMFIRRLETNKELEARLVGQIGERTDGYIYGIAFLDPAVNFWNIDFPPPTASEKKASRMLLQCTGCPDREEVFLDAVEQDIYAVNQGILRHCKHCGIQTVWKQVRGVDRESPAAKPAAPAPAASAPSAPAPQPVPTPVAPPVPAAPQENRRREVRAKVNLKACVRYSGIDEVVECENMSRGGVCFRSRKQYTEQCMVEIAVPYTPGGQSIFVRAEILHVQELPAAKLFRCGAVYLKSPKFAGDS